MPGARGIRALNFRARNRLCGSLQRIRRARRRCRQPRSSGVVTFQPADSLRIDLVRRAPITSALLIVVVVTSASACVAGCGSPTEFSCARASIRRAFSEKKARATTNSSACGDVLKAQPGRCGMRSFIPFQFAALPAFEMSSPLLRTNRNIPVPLDSVILVSSIGSPETDRGPPRS